MKKILYLLLLLLPINIYALEISCPSGDKFYNDYFSCNLINEANRKFDSISGQISFSSNLRCVISDVNSEYKINKKENILFSLGEGSSRDILSITCHVINNVNSPNELIKIDNLEYSIDGKKENVILKSDYIKLSNKTKVDSNQFSDTSNVNSLLDNLDLGIESPDYIFSRFITSYSFQVDYDVSSINPSYKAVNENAIVESSNLTNLKVGENKYNVCVTSPDYASKTCYIINITRVPAGETAYSALSDVSINDIKIKDIELKFKTDVKEYNIFLPEDVDQIYINVDKNYDHEIVDISRTNKLKNNDKIYIKITSENKQYNDEYVINIHRRLEKKSYKEYIILGISGIFILGLVITLMVTTSKKKKNKKVIKDDLDD